VNPGNKELKNLEESSTKNSKRHETGFNLKAPRAQGGKGIFSHTISLQELKNPWPRTSPREEREEGTERERRSGRLGSSVF